MQKSIGSKEQGEFSQSLNSTPWWVNSSNRTQFMSQAPVKDKVPRFQVAASAGDTKNTSKDNDNDVSNHQANMFPLPQQRGYFELGLAQPMVYANYPLGDQCHGLFTAYGTQPMGRVMLPLNLATEDGLIYVNPKQYDAILRRRKVRAREGLQNKPSKEKPYRHESRHRHACRRPRGAGGRFLNTKELNEGKDVDEVKKTASQSSSSEVLQSESGNFNSNNRRASNFSSSEVTSMYGGKDFDCFSIDHDRPFSNNWVAAADGCCNFFKI